MINKRQLIQNLLAHNDEGSFYDKKEVLTLSTKEGKAKFLKHVCALANSNPYNNAYILGGVTDRDSELKGTSFFDDSKIQNLVDAYIAFPPLIRYENIEFPHLKNSKVIGLVTITAKHERYSSLKKKIWKYTKGTVFIRRGSISYPYPKEKQQQIPKRSDSNSSIVYALEKKSFTSMKLMLEGVINFVTYYKDYDPKYLVFKECFVLCWVGRKISNKVAYKTAIAQGTYYSRLDIQLVNEQVKLFYSNLDKVTVCWTKDSFEITEYISLQILSQSHTVPLERITILFKNNGNYEIDKEWLFRKFEIDQDTIEHLMKRCRNLVNRIAMANNSSLKQVPIWSLEDKKQIQYLCDHLLIGYVTGYTEVKKIIMSSTLASFFKKQDKAIYKRYKNITRIIRKINYY